MSERLSRSDVLRVAASEGRTVVLDRPLCQSVVYPSVDVASAAARDGETTTSNPAKEDLATEFDDLADQYGQMIDHCRQLLQKVELSAGGSAQPSREQ